MEQRCVPTIFGQNANKQGNEKKERNQFLNSLWISVFFSLFMIPIVIMGESYIFQ